MREILPQSIAELKKLWIISEEGCSLDVTLCSCSACAGCNCLIYDEELMAGWRVDDLNNDSVCPYCSHPFVPSLKVSIQNRRRQKISSSWYAPLSISISGEENDAVNLLFQNKQDDEFSVPFVSPLVLRRQLESMLLSDPLVLSEVSMRLISPDVFWNLLYYCRRLDLPTHIVTWISPHVHIRCVYDLPSLHPESESPIYFANHQKETESAVLSPFVSSADVRLWQNVVDSLQTSNLFLILKHIINGHRERKDAAVGLRGHFSIYRDILFVALDRFGRSVDREQFDRQYSQELEHLPPRILSLLSVRLSSKSSDDCLPKNNATARHLVVFHIYSVDLNVFLMDITK
uniref:Uncharacterized protein n=1 Tax=Ditylenchus dipsaci TaxID=166011 RepID=A0A915ES78_9BILA